MPTAGESTASSTEKARPISSPGTAPYRTAFAASVGSAIAAGLVVAGADVAFTLKDAQGWKGADAWSFAAVAAALYASAALGVGLVEGLVAGAVRATHPGGVGAAWRRLRGDADADRRVAAALLAAVAASALFAAIVAVLALRLVGAPARKGVGALLCGGLCALAVPVAFLGAYPIYRVTRRLARFIPRLGVVPASVLTVATLLAVVVVAGRTIVVTRLDYQVLQLGAPIAALSFLLVQGSMLLLRGPIARAWRSARGRGTAVLATAVLVAVGTPLVVAGARPSPRAVSLMLVDSGGARVLVALARRLSDRDRDGYAALLGGGDCDDRAASVHPGAHDVPGNGVDENCLGGDAKVAQPGGGGGGGGAGAAPEGSSSKAQAFRWTGNILVITVDTVRADRLGAAGYTRRGGKSLTPRMDAFVKEAIWFQRAYAQAPNTPRSFPSFFLSRYPSRVKWDKEFANYARVLPENVSVFETLRDAGLKTIGFSSHHYFTEERGIIQGFVEYDNAGATNIKDSNHDISAPRITPRVTARLAELGKSRERFALFVHFAEPHSTYMEHAEFPISSRGVEGLEEKYDYEIAFVDRYVGEVLDALAAAGLAEGTLVVLNSDHAEAFGAHRFGGQRMFFHGQTLYDELLAVPLAIRVPGLAPRAVPQPVMLLDVAPTLLDAIKAPVPADFQGRSLLPALVGDALDPRPVHAELLPAPSWDHAAKMRIDADGRSKIIYRPRENLFELYDVVEDPTEQRDLARDRADLLARMKAELASWMESEL